MRFLAMAAVLLLFLPLHARAQDCENPASTAEERFCAAQAFDAADADLNNVYRVVRADMRRFDEGLPPDLQGAAEALRQAQLAWIAYRDKACEAEGYLFRGGTMEPVVVLYCKARLTRARAEDLRGMVGN